ncbi:MAG TPA: alpha/beta hydrolase [Bacteroidales bacterium]|nr:alpha/beta hydrolase [Bacteroidales bacterium]
MLKSVPFHNSSVHFDDLGSGKVIVLVHGYLETMEIWSEFARQLAKTYRVIVIDVPGHGKSGKVGNIHPMDLMADAINSVLTFLRIEKCFLVGHSMGGYVALAFMAKYRYKVNGICLFHSTPFADTEEKKTKRDREIALIREGKKDVLFNANIPNGFATDNLNALAAQVERAKAIAAHNSEEGIMALIEGMKARPDRQNLLKETGLPILFILGKKDNYIPYDLMHSVAQRSATGEILTLQNSGHMGFIEEPEICLQTLGSFVHPL